MKVVDMFGAGIPVLAVHYPALNQLLKDGENGHVFHTNFELSEQLLKMSQDKKALKTIQEGAKKQKRHTWDVEWKKKFFNK